MATIHTPAELAAFIDATLPDNTDGNISALDMRTVVEDVLESARAWGGWGEFGDTANTSGSPQLLVADTDTILEIDGLSGVQTKIPPDVVLFAAGKIVGNATESRTVTVDFKIKPTEVGTTYVELWIDIGGAFGPLYKAIKVFPKGNGVERSISRTILLYTAATFEANGGTIYIRTNGTAEVYDARVIIQRSSVDLNGAF